LLTGGHDVGFQAEPNTLTLLCQAPVTLGPLWRKAKGGTLEYRKNIFSLAILNAVLARVGKAMLISSMAFSRNPEAGRLKRMSMAPTTVYDLPQPRVRVLIADDHEVMRMGIRNLLQFRSGWSVCAEASNGEEAVAKTLQFNPDVVVMDLTMPIMNGLEAAREIARAQPQIPIILFSLHVSDNLYPDLQKQGIRGAVAKGDAARDLADAVEAVLKGGTFFPSRKVAS
jgi:CheY-like chemotaxis protein